MTDSSESTGSEFQDAGGSKEQQDEQDLASGLPIDPHYLLFLEAQPYFYGEGPNYMSERAQSGAENAALRGTADGATTAHLESFPEDDEEENPWDLPGDIAAPFVWPKQTAHAEFQGFRSESHLGPDLGLHHEMADWDARATGEGIWQDSKDVTQPHIFQELTQELRNTPEHKVPGVTEAPAWRHESDLEQHVMHEHHMDSRLSNSDWPEHEPHLNDAMQSAIDNNVTPGSETGFQFLKELHTADHVHQEQDHVHSEAEDITPHEHKGWNRLKRGDQMRHMVETHGWNPEDVAEQPKFELGVLHDSDHVDIGNYRKHRLAHEGDYGHEHAPELSELLSQQSEKCPDCTGNKLDCPTCFGLGWVLKERGVKQSRIATSPGPTRERSYCIGTTQKAIVMDRDDHGDPVQIRCRYCGKTVRNASDIMPRHHNMRSPRPS